MKKIRANVCAVTHAGRVRRENEDNYSLNGRLTSTGDLKKGSAFVQSMNEPFHLAVCDGMGGESYGDIASGIATETIASQASNVYDSGEDFSFAISNSLVESNARICDEITARGKRMGTTLAAVYVVKGKVYCVNIGDTRIYHYSKGILEQISFDHTHAQTMVDAGEAMLESIGNIPDAKRLTRHLGVFPEEANLSPNISVIDDVDNGDALLLCSDGLTDMLSDDEITGILSTAESAQDAAGQLVRLSLERGGKDNITAIAAFLSVEETAIFAPIAAAMVGDSETSYEEEYRHSYGNNQPVDEEETVSPYANADARAHIKPVDKMQIVKIAGIVVLCLAILAVTAFIIKSVLFNGGGNEDDTTTTSQVPTYNFADSLTNVITEPMMTITEPSETTTEEEKSTTKKPKPSTTKPAATTTKPADEPTEEATTQEQTTEAETTTQEQTTEEQTTAVQDTTAEETPANDEGAETE
ncbi:MAG: serine/threonine-protein phosphatase [Clostridia bacterium]|nr:serine/threonine-protein phosphatase [Clostridia bacterium]